MMTSQCPLSKKGVSQLCQDQGQHTLYWHSAAKSEKYVQFWDVTITHFLPKDVTKISRAIISKTIQYRHAFLL